MCIRDSLGSDRGNIGHLLQGLELLFQVEVEQLQQHRLQGRHLDQPFALAGDQHVGLQAALLAVQVEGCLLYTSTGRLGAGKLPRQSSACCN